MSEKSDAFMDEKACNRVSVTRNIILRNVYLMDYILEDVFKDDKEKEKRYDTFVKIGNRYFKLNVFYPVHIEDDNDWSVAYLMNDAVESFLHSQIQL